MRMAALLCLALAIPGVAAAAADAPAASVAPAAPDASDALPPGLLPLLQRPDHQAALLQAARAVDATPQGACADARYAPSGDIGMLVPLAVGSDGQPTAGVWKESMTETGCGAPRTLNMLTVVEQGGRLATRPLLPGSTITDPQLQQDSVRYAAAAMGGLPPGCTRGAVTDTAYVGLVGQPPGTLPTQGAAPQAWNERWTLQACSKRVVVGMQFTPDAQGTAIQATPPAGP